MSDEDVLCLFAPPGSAKSTYTSVLLPTAYLARFPENQILAATHSELFAQRWGRKVRGDVLLDGHMLGLALAPGQSANDRWAVQSGGEYYGVGAGTGISGFRANLGLADDLFGSKKDAFSETVRTSRWEWWLNDFSARLRPDAKRILMSTRWHMGDVAGRVLDQIEAKVLKGRVVTLRAVAEADDPLGRPVGTYLWDEPGAYNYGQFLRQREREVTPGDWEAMYQQRPVAESGGYFKLEWIKRFRQLPPVNEMSFYGASDYAVTSNGGDYTVHVIIGMDLTGNLYLVDMWRGQTSSDVWAQTMADLIIKWKPMGWAEEMGQIKAGVGPFLDQVLWDRGAYIAREQFPTRGDKAIRAQSIRGRMAMRGLYIPFEAPTPVDWRKPLLAELLTFDRGVNDDIVDALGLAGQLLNQMVGGYKEEPKPPREIDGYKAYDNEERESLVTL